MKKADKKMYDMHEYEYRKFRWKDFDIVLFPPQQKQQTPDNNLFILYGDGRVKWELSELHLKQERICTEISVGEDDTLRFTMSNGMIFRVLYMKIKNTGNIVLQCAFDPYFSEKGIYDKKQHEYNEVQSGDRTVLHFIGNYLERNLFILNADGEAVWKMKEIANGFLNCYNAVVKNGKLFYYTKNSNSIPIFTVMDIESLDVKFKNAVFNFGNNGGGTI